MNYRFVLFILWAAVAACDRSAPSSVPQSLEPPQVDSTRVRSPADVAGWKHRRALEADLNGDGTKEVVILASDVQLGSDAAPIWEDGHRWAVFVEKPEVTLLYAAFVPNGLVEAAVLMPDADGRRHVVVLERTPYHARSVVVSYDKPGMARTVSASRHEIDEWFPALTNP